jgi:hypothetical protein
MFNYNESTIAEYDLEFYRLYFSILRSHKLSENITCYVNDLLILAENKDRRFGHLFHPTAPTVLESTKQMLRSGFKVNV